MSVKIFVFLLVVFQGQSYIQFQLTRIPKKTNLQRIATDCQDPKTIDSQTMYRQVCYPKDLAYAIQFEQHPVTYLLALDLTTPISWIKGQHCKITSSSKKCNLIEANIAERINNVLRHKVTQLVQKLKLKIADEQSNNAIIQGSNQIVMGSVQKLVDFDVVARNTDHVNKILDMVMLGLFIIGEKDNITLKDTTFINAHEISPNLEGLEDGAISMRFDQNSQNSFLKELFTYLKVKEQIISVYLGQHASLATVGSYDIKYMREGIGSLRRIKIQQDDKHGKLPSLQSFIFQHADIEDGTIQTNSSVIFTLSASYISLPKEMVQNFIKKFIKKPNSCKMDQYLECTFKKKEELQTFIGSTINFDFDTSLINFEMGQLLLKKEGHKLKFNIKQSVNQFVVLGEPFFLKYYVYFDYGKDQIGYAERTLSIEQNFIQMATLIHFIMLVFLFGCCMMLSSQTFRGLYYRMFEWFVFRAQPTIRRLKVAYRPVQGESGEEGRDGHGGGYSPSLGEDVEGL